MFTNDWAFVWYQHCDIIQSSRINPSKYNCWELVPATWSYRCLKVHEIKLTWNVVVISGVIVRVPPFSVVCGGRINSLVEAVTLLPSKWNVKFILSSETRKTLSATSSFASLDLLRWNLSTIFCWKGNVLVTCYMYLCHLATNYTDLITAGKGNWVMRLKWPGKHGLIHVAYKVKVTYHYRSWVGLLRPKLFHSFSESHLPIIHEVVSVHITFRHLFWRLFTLNKPINASTEKNNVSQVDIPQGISLLSSFA